MIATFTATTIVATNTTASRFPELVCFVTRWPAFVEGESAPLAVLIVFGCAIPGTPAAGQSGCMFVGDPESRDAAIMFARPVTKPPPSYSAGTPLARHCRKRDPWIDLPVHGPNPHEFLV